MDSRDILPPEFPSEDSFSSIGMITSVDGELVKKTLSTHIEDNLSRLFECLKLEYGRRILVSPKWKNFGSQKLLLSEKTRLNNAIWRCWHIQYQKHKKPLFCQFVSPLSEEREPPKKPLAIILQGRFWRRKLDAIAREYKNWRTYYKQKTHEDEEEAKRERLRTLSTSSGDDEVSYGSPLTQMVHLMDKQLTTDMVQSHPDTLFTTKTEVHQNPKQKVPEATISEITFQPSLDSLQPNLDDFSKHIESLVDFLSQAQPNEAFQLASGFDSSKNNLQFGTNQLTFPTNPNMTSFQREQNNVEMMDQSYDIYNVPTGERQTNQPIQQVTTLPQNQDFMDTTENFQEYAMDYDNQIGLQAFSPSSGQPLSHEGIPLEHVEEEVEQELFVNQGQSQSTVIQGSEMNSPQKSPLPILPMSPEQQIAGSCPQDQKIMIPSQTCNLPYRHSSGNLQEYGTSPVRKGRLPRNISDNQLSLNDSSHMGLGLSFLQSQETKIPTQVQFPNLVAHLQSSNVSQSEAMASATKAKRPRIPRNMSDSGLYDMSRTSKGQTSVEASCLSQFSTLANSPVQHSTQQTPLEQIRAQAAQSESQLLPMPFYSTPASQSKHSRLRKGKLPRNMSDSSLMYMTSQQLSHQNVPMNLKGLSTHTKKLGDSLQVMSQGASLSIAHPVMSSSNQAVDPLANLQGAHPVYNSSTLASSPPYDAKKQDGTVPMVNSTTGTSHYGQILLDHDERKSSLSSAQASTSVPSKNVQSYTEHAQTTSLLSQLLLQGDSSSEPQKGSTKEQENQIKQLLQVVNKQRQLPSSNQQSSQLMSLLQGVSSQQRTSDSAESLITSSTSSSQLYQILSQPEQPQQQKSVQLQQQQQQQQPQQHVQISQQGKGKHKHQTTEVLEKELQKQLLQQQEQLQQQARENQKTSQLISALKSTSHVLQQQLGGPQQLQQLLEQQNLQSQGLPGTFFSSKQRITTRQSNVTIQPKPVTTQTTTHQAYPGTVPIVPYPRVTSVGGQEQARVQLVPQQPVQMGTSNVQPLTPSLISLHQMLEASATSQSALKPESLNTVAFKSSDLPQHPTGTSSGPFSFPQVLFTPGTMTTASSTSNETTSGIIGALNVNTETHSGVRSTTSPLTPKFTRPISASERENYKEHRRQSHITAEQKRRCNIKVGFDQLLNLVPALAHQKTSKISKATILQKAVEYTTKLQRERVKMTEEEELLRKEIQSLHSSISACQQQLPASGVPVNRQRSDQMLTLYNQYVKSRTQENFKFWILAVIFRQMFEVYNQSVSTNTWQEFCANILSWLDEQCTLPNLRPAVLSALRDITRSTSILTEPLKFPDEIQHYVAANSDPSVIMDSASLSSTSTKRNPHGRNFFNTDGMS